MDTNTPKKLQTLGQAFRDFVFNSAFFVGLVAGFILGIVASFILGIVMSPILSLVAGFILGIIGSIIGNYFWEKYKKRKQGKEPYWYISASQGNLQFEGKVQDTASNRNVLQTLPSLQTTDTG